MKTSRPVWCDENEDVETAAVIEIDGAEYRQTEGHDPKGIRTDGADPMGLKNNPDGANSPDGSQGLKEGPRA